MANSGGNSGRYTLCPFYKWDYEARITCEDTYRHFESLLERCSWMDMYCDNEWMKCPFAVDLSEAYAKLEKGDENALENQKIEAMQKELKSMATKLGMAEKKITRLQKALDKEKELNKSWQAKHEEDEKKKKMFHSHLKECQKELAKDNSKMIEELHKMGEIYEQRMCCLIDKYTPDKRLTEADVKEWAGDKAFALTHEFTNYGDLVWIVKFEEKKDGEDDGATVPGDDGAEPDSK